MTKSGSERRTSPSQMIDARIEELGDSRGEMLSRLRALVGDRPSVSMTTNGSMTVRAIW